MIRDKLIAQLTLDEGKRNKPYKDSVGKLTIGIGRNLDDIGVSDDEINFMLSNDIDKVAKQLDDMMPWWRSMNDARQNAFCNFVFNVGIGTAMTFKNSLALLQAGKYVDAADAMMQSKWASQVGNRAVRITSMLRRGEF
jgi:lysozyme